MNSKSVIIIAEAGVNHNGDLNIAHNLVDAAADAGADYVKFQLFKAKNLVTRIADKAEYQKKATGKSESQYEMIRRLELTKDCHVKLKEYCDHKKIGFLSSPFDLESIEFLDSIDIDFFKIPSGEIVNMPYLRKIARCSRPVVLSTGMSTLKEIQEALGTLIDNGILREHITILHCNTEYPTPIKDVNLKAMNTIEKELGVRIGYSDHTKGMAVPIAAVALGARVIEKHFTLDKNMEGPDHKASMNPTELKQMIESIRTIESCLGDGIKCPSPSEIKNLKIARKSIVAAKKIKKGEEFTENNIIPKRPGNGISPMCWDEVIGQTAKKDFLEDELIEL